MNILHISTTDYNGAGSCCYKIHKSLQELGINSKILVLSKRTNDKNVILYKSKKLLLWKIFNKCLRILHLTITDYNKRIKIASKSKGFISLPTSVIDVTSHPLIKEADIIHLHWINNFIDYPSFFSKINKPIVWTLHDENLFYGIAHYEQFLDNNSLEKKYQNIKYKSISKIKKMYVVFLSKMMYRKYVNSNIIANANKIIINNSVDYKQFIIFNRNEARQYFNLDKNKIYIIFIAVNIFEERKGLKVLINALKQINNKNIKILAIGNCPINFNDDLIISLGPIKDTRTLSLAYSCGNYFVMPSFQEAFAQTPLEAMACGLPAIVFPTSGTEELIREYNGVVCEGFSVKDLIKGLNKAFNTQYNSLEIRQDMINRFSPQIIGSEYIKVYKELIENKDI